MNGFQFESSIQTNIVHVSKREASAKFWLSKQACLLEQNNDMK